MKQGTVASNYFRVDGADSESGQETFLVLRAKSKPHAERLAQRQGLLVASVRIAKAADWEQAPRNAAPAPAVEMTGGKSAMDKTESSPTLQPADPLAPLPGPLDLSSRIAAESRARLNTIVFCAVGGALVVGGVLTLALALWPDDGVRNELQQIDFRLHELSQTILGSMLVLGGLIVFVLAAVMRNRRSDE